MDEAEWVRVAAARLRAQWPHVADEQLQEAAQELWQHGCWRCQPPVLAVVEWLRLGVLHRARTH